jgi:two-component system sensor histidine kinase BarA
MIHTRPFTRRIVLLGVLPVFLTICFLAVTFIFIQGRLINSLERQISNIAEATLLPLLANESIDHALLVQTAPLVLGIETISHLSVYDNATQKLENLALPFNHLDEIPLQATKSVKAINNIAYYTIPVPSENHQRWLIVGIQKSALEVSRYKGYLVLTFIAVFVFVVTLHFASRLYDAVTTPLKDILSDLRQTLHNHSGKPLNNSKNHLYNELIESLNEMILIQQSIREEMQINVDQSTKELRETLETVEIQNIELDFARKNALQASRAKSEFLANTSHELRTPLNGILGFTSLLLKTNITNQQKDYLTTIEQSAQGLLTVINDILDFSKLETGQLTLEYKPIYVRELIEEVFAIYAPQAHEKNMRLVSIINHNVPRNLLGDPLRLKQVISNLISNSIKFSLHGNIVVRAISLGEMDNQIEIKFSVTDNGIGLSHEQQENLFSAFTKVDNSDSRFQGGTGLGLAIAKGLVDRMKGEIGVDSELQKGATFWFTVRLGIDRQRISQSPFVNSLYGLNALIFDCNAVCRMEITHLLSNWGVNFVEENVFNNIPNVIAANHENQPVDILILDAYTEENNFDRERLLEGIQKIRMIFKLPAIVLAPPALQRILQEEMAGLNSLIVQRPVVHSQLHQAMCSLLNIAQRLPMGVQENTSPPLVKNDSLRILVVDDNPANLKLVCEFLRGLGVETRAFNNGYDAIEAYDKESFDLILMDVQMPGMDGLETTKALRARETEKRTPVVALTAHAVNEQKTQLLLAGMDDFLSKPVSEDDLKHIIERWAKSGGRAEQQENPSNGVEEIAAPAQNAASTPIKEDNATFFDWGESMRLARNKPELATDMLKMLIASLPETMESIKEAVAAHDMDRLLEITHKLHGGCCYCGVPALRMASKTLEQKLHQKEYANVNALADALIREAQVLLGWSDELDIDVLFADYDD